MKRNLVTEEDLKVFEANMQRIKVWRMVYRTKGGGWDGEYL
jgi:hypothetical protein